MKVNYRILKMSTFLLLISSLTVQCEKDDPISNPPVPDAEELITTMQLEFVDSAGVLPTQTFVFKDIDGPGGNSPSQFDTIILQPNETYYVSMSLLNESATPAEDITAEIVNEADEHLFCFTPNISGNCTIVRTDTDGVFEIGLTSKWTSSNTSLGSVLIQLKHQPGVKDGTCSPGETDIEINFPLKIQ